MSAHGDSAPSTLLTRQVGAPLAAAAAIVTIAALATATVLRPRGGFTSTLHLLAALALGASAALLALLAATAVAAIVRGRRGRATPPLPLLALAALAAALLLAASLQALRTADSPTATAAPSPAASEFARWQQQVVPIVVSYITIVRADATLLRRPPRTRSHLLRAEQRVRAGATTLRHDTAALAHLPSADPDLTRLSRRLRTALRLAQRGQAKATAALSDAAAPRRSLLAQARRALRSSQQAMAVFTLKANMLGAQLNAQP